MRCCLSDVHGCFCKNIDQDLHETTSDNIHNVETFLYFPRVYEQVLEFGVPRCSRPLAVLCSLFQNTAKTQKLVRYLPRGLVWKFHESEDIEDTYVEVMSVADWAVPSPSFTSSVPCSSSGVPVRSTCSPVSCCCLCPSLRRR